MTREDIKQKYGYGERKTDNFLRRAARGLTTLAGHPYTLLLVIILAVLAVSIWYAMR